MMATAQSSGVSAEGTKARMTKGAESTFTIIIDTTKKAIGRYQESFMKDHTIRDKPPAATTNVVPRSMRSPSAPRFAKIKGRSPERCHSTSASLANPMNKKPARENHSGGLI